MGSRQKRVTYCLITRCLLPITHCLVLITLLLFRVGAAQAAAAPPTSHLTQPGETLATFALRAGAALDSLAHDNFVVHPLIPFPVAGTPLQLTPEPRPPIPSGRWLARLSHESLGAIAVRANLNPWVIAWGNGLDNPHRPLGVRVFIPGSGPPPAALPGPLAGVRVAPLPAVAGQALQVRVWVEGNAAVSGNLEGHQLRFAPDAGSQVALLGLGGFVEPADYHLNLIVGDQTWTSQVRTVEPSYGVEEIWLTGETQQYLDAEAIRAEQTRLDAIFALHSPEKQWDDPWRLPILGEYTITSAYGTRRSYNGGPARSYHEGVDFNGLVGRTVVAPAAGDVVLAEPLYVRGSAVILYHGMGVYSGYYHLSQIEVTAGQSVLPGQKLGEVGSTGLSTGSHLHWDVVVAGINVDGLAWRELTAGWQ